MSRADALPLDDAPRRDSTPDAASPRILRQTQAVIGAVLLGLSAAAYYMDAAWLLGPAFIGAALIVAGSTGVCPMASMIARLPWNRGAPTGPTCCTGPRH